MLSVSSWALKMVELRQWAENIHMCVCVCVRARVWQAGSLLLSHLGGPQNIHIIFSK